MQIVIPMSGFGERFRRAGYVMPKPLIEIDGKPIIAHVIDLFPGETDFIFICNRDHLAEPSYRMEETIRRYCPTGRVVAIDAHKLGPVHAVLQVANLIDPQQPVVVNYADFTCYWNWGHFRDFVAHNKCDGAIPAYKEFHPHTLGTTNYAYMREADGWVLDIQEKQPYTDNRMEEHASSGTYYFSSGQLMLDAFQTTKDRNLNVGGEFYVSLAYKPMLESGKRVAVYELRHFMQWGTPEDVAEYRMWSETFRRLADPAYASVPALGGTTLIPMAGLGERFLREGYTVTKPLIPVSGKPMVVQATADLPVAGRHVFVLRQDMPGLDEIRSTLHETFLATHCVILDGPTDGQARTALLGLRAALSTLENDGLLTIAACDNGALYKPERLQALLDDPDTDVIVWVARGHPNAVRNPQMYGWVACLGNSDCVSGVSVKKPLADPKYDPVITGTFTFRRGSDFVRAVERMIKRDARVNGEFYIDTCIEDALALGLTVRIFEIDSYLCWGTPDDLRTFEYWQSCFDKWPGHPYCLKDDRRVAAQYIDGTASKLSGHGSVPARVTLMQRVDGELPRFVIVGVGSNLLNFLAYLLTHALGAPLVVASGAGYLTGLVNSYYFGRNWVFGAGDRTGRLAILYFIIVYAIGGIGMSTIIEVLDRTQGLDYRVSWFFGAVFAFTNNFLGSKWLVFKGRKIHDGN